MCVFVVLIALNVAFSNSPIVIISNQAEAIRNSSISDRDKGKRLHSLIQLGMTREEVNVTVFGNAAHSVIAIGPNPFSQYRYPDYRVTVFFGIDGKAYRKQFHD